MMVAYPSFEKTQDKLILEQLNKQWIELWLHSLNTTTEDAITSFMSKTS